MKMFTRLLLIISTQLVFFSSFGQITATPGNCSGTTNSLGYFGGFEAGSGNFGPNTGSDLYLGLPRNGSYQVVQNVNQLGGGGYLNIRPRTGSYFLASHTSNNLSERIWYTKIAVTPGQTVNFCAAFTLLKNLGSGANFIIGIYANGKELATGRVNFNWTQICGTYIVPAGVTSVELSIRDPKKGLFFVALDDICVSTTSPGKLKLGNQVWNDRDGDGKRDPNEPAIPGAPISLYRDNVAPFNEPDGAAFKTTTSDDQGRYLFTELPAGRYIASMPILPGYQQSPNNSTQLTSPFPDNNIDNDNNLVRRVGPNGPGGVVYSNAITLTENLEPITDGDDANGNLTFDLAECGNSFIGDFVWNDLDGDGIQDAGEPGINGVTVTITFPDGKTSSEVTHRYEASNNQNAPQYDGYYDFENLGPGTYKITFPNTVTLPETSEVLNPSPANQGGNDAKDSDPVNGIVMVTIAANESNFTIDAGYTSKKPPVACPNLSLGNLVFNDANNNGKKDATEVGIPGVSVRLYTDNDGNNAPDAAAVSMVQTDEEGTYLFTNLAPGRYIVGIVLTSGYTQGTVGSATPDDNVNNDNNGIRTVSGEVRSNFITLSAGDEPTNDGSDNNSNLTLDFGLKAKPGTPLGTCPPNSIYGDTFENGVFNNGGSDLHHGLPRNGSYQIVQNVDQLGGGGYLNIRPRTGNYFLASHTSNDESERIWYSKVTVTPGQTYNFCAAVTLLKNLGSGANFIVGVYANGTQIGTGRVTFDWTQICGTYKVPSGVTTVEFSIQDPKKGLFFLAIDDICITPAGSPSPAPRAIVDNPSDNAKSVVEAKMALFPNPANTYAVVDVNAIKAGKATVKVINLDGKTVLTQETRVSIGKNAIKLNNLNSMASGTYNVQLLINGEMYNEKIVIAK